jgi:hypothetical protein
LVFRLTCLLDVLPALGAAFLVVLGFRDFALPGFFLAIDYLRDRGL